MLLIDYFKILWKSWLLIFAAVILGTAVAAGATMLIKPKYHATTELYVSVLSGNQTSADLLQGSNFARQNVQSYVNIVGSDSVLRPVISNLDLDQSVEALSKQISASVPLNTSIIDIAVSDEDPSRAAQIANAVGASFTRLIESDLEVFSKNQEQFSPVKISTVQPAVKPISPDSPKLFLNLMVGLLVGLIIGIGIAFLRAALDTRVHSIKDIEELVDAPMLGAIAYDKEAKFRPLIVHVDPLNPRAESFRTLRTNFQFLAVNTHSNRGRSFVISSAGPGEGKSTTTANLAIALSESGARVALIDGDLRLPKVAEYMGIEGGAGLTDVLIGRAELSDVLQRWKSDQLFVLPAGRIPPNPSELLGSDAMDELLSNLHDDFDYVLIDAPPVLLVTDAAVLSTRTSGAILLVAAGNTRKPAVQLAARALATAGAQLRGMVVTMLPKKDMESYGYGMYGYGQTSYARVESDGAASKLNSATQLKNLKPSKTAVVQDLKLLTLESIPSSLKPVEDIDAPDKSRMTDKLEQPRVAISVSRPIKPVIGSVKSKTLDAKSAMQQPVAKASDKGSEARTHRGGAKPAKDAVDVMWQSKRSKVSGS